MKDSFLLKIIKIGIYLALFSPLVIEKHFYFPYISVRTFFFWAIAEIIFFFYVLLAVSFPKYRPKFSGLAWSFLGFIAVLFITGFFGLNFYKSFWGGFERMWGIITPLHFFLFFIVISNVLKLKDWQRVFNVGIFVGVLTSIYGLAQGFSLFPSWIPYSGVRPLIGTLGNSAYLAGYLIFPIFLSLWFFLKSRRENKGWKIYCYLFAAILQLTVFSLTSIRGALLGLIAGLVLLIIFYLIFSSSKKTKLTSLVILLALILLGGLFYFQRNASWVKWNPVVGKLFAISLKETTAQTRLIAWQTGLKAFKEHPILGWGPENYNLAFDKYLTTAKLYEVSVGEAWWDRPHNVVIEMLVIGGILGLLAYLSIFFFFYFYLYQAWRQGKIGFTPTPEHRGRDVQVWGFTAAAILGSAVAAYFVQNLFLFDTLTPFLMFIVILGFLEFLVKAEVAGTGQSTLKIERKQEELGIGQNDSRPRYWLIVVLLALLVFSLFKAVYRPMLASLEFNKMFGDAGNIAQAAEDYKKAVSYQTYANRDIRKRFIYWLIDGVTNQKISDADGLKYLRFALNEALQNIKENPNDGYFYLQYGTLFNLLQDKYKMEPGEEVKKILEKAIELAPSRLESYYVYAQMLSQENKFDEALALLKRALAMDEDFSETYWRLGIIYKMAGDNQRAYDNIKKSFDLGIKLKRANQFQWAADAFLKVKDYQNAVKAYEGLVELEPKNFQHRASLAAGYAMIGEKEKARVEALKVLELSPESKESVEAFLKTL